jgi:hypothetical protein
LEVAGVKNALSKSLGSSNKTNTAYATIAALDSLVPASKWVTTRPKTKKTVTIPAATSDADDKPTTAAPKKKPVAKTAKKKA